MDAFGVLCSLRKLGRTRGVIRAWARARVRARFGKLGVFRPEFKGAGKLIGFAGRGGLFVVLNGITPACAWIMCETLHGWLNGWN